MSNRAITQQSDNLVIESTTYQANADTLNFDADIAEARRGEAESKIASLEGQISSTEAQLNPPPTKQVTKSAGKSGTKETTEVDYQAKQALEAKLASLKSQKGIVESSLGEFSSQADIKTGEASNEQGKADDLLTRASQIESINKDLEFLEEVAKGENGFFNESEEKSFIENLEKKAENARNYEEKDLDGDGINEGDVAANAVDAYLDPNNGFPSFETQYASDFIRDGQEVPWEAGGDEVANVVDDTEQTPVPEENYNDSILNDQDTLELVNNSQYNYNG